MVAHPEAHLRSAQYDAIYVSPHMDDAVYSCGGQIALERARGARVLVVTVFGDAGAARREGVFGDWEQRKREEIAAMERLDCDYLWLDAPDALCRPRRASDIVRYALLPFVSLSAGPLDGQLLASLLVVCERLLAPGGRTYFPLGIGFHPDHRVLYALGRTLSVQLPVTFYEDIPYAQVDALRRDRLRYLGQKQPAELWPDARAIDALVFPRVPSWQKPATRLVVAGHLVLTRGLYRLTGERMHEPAPSGLALDERVIDAVIAEKVGAMRAYETQTAHFFPPGEAIYGALCRSGGHYVERFWTLTMKAASPPRLDAQERAAASRRLAALLAEPASSLTAASGA